MDKQAIIQQAEDLANAACRTEEFNHDERGNYEEIWKLVKDYIRHYQDLLYERDKAALADLLKDSSINVDFDKVLVHLLAADFCILMFADPSGHAKYFKMFNEDIKGLFNVSVS